MADTSRFLDLEGLSYYHEKVKTLVKDNAGAGDVTYTNTEPTLTSLGGIPAGQTFDGVTIQDMLTKLLYPYTKPTLSSLTVTPGGGVFEKGVTIDVTKLQVTATKKTEPIAKIEFLQAGSVIATQTEGVATGGTFVVEPSPAISVAANTNFTARATDSAATAGVTTTAAVSYTFVDPFYYGAMAQEATVDSDSITALTKSVTVKGNKTITVTANQQYTVFAYPASYGTLRVIYDANNFDVTGTFVRTTMDVMTLAGTATSYYVYRSATPATVTAFTMKFNFT